jgi:hypothetical protein
MEQRINSLEEELKVLKNQIKAVLLDIKEYLATSNGHTYAPPQEGDGPVVASPVHKEIEHVQDSLSQGPQSVLPDTGLGDRSAGQQAQPALVPTMDQPLEVDTITVRDGSESRVVDLLTVSVLVQWLSRAISALGKNQIVKLVEIYDITGNMAPRLKDTMLALIDLCGDGGQAEDAPATDDVPASVSIQLLIELDSLLRYRKGALESVVLSQLMDKGLSGRKAR